MITLKQLKEQLSSIKEYIDSWPKWKKEQYKRADLMYEEENKLKFGEFILNERFKD